MRVDEVSVSVLTYDWCKMSAGIDTVSGAVSSAAECLQETQSREGHFVSERAALSLQCV